MLSFFKSLSKPPVHRPSEMTLALATLQATIIYQAIQIEPRNKDSGYIYFDNASVFLSQIRQAIYLLDTVPNCELRYFRINFCSDLNTLSLKSIANYQIFFQAFKTYPIELTIDYKQLASWEVVKLEAMLQTLLSSTVVCLRIAYPLGTKSSESLISADKILLIQTLLPQVTVEKAQYFKLDDRPLSQQLIYAMTTGTLSDSKLLITPSAQDKEKQFVSSPKL